MHETRHLMAFRMFVLSLTAFAAAFLLSCGKQEPASKAAGVNLTGAGATFPEPLYKRWIDQYMRQHPHVRVAYEGVGSGEGVKRFIRGEVDFGASDAAMNDEEISRVERGVNLIPATGGIVVLAYNIEGVVGDLKLPREVYLDIFLGKIKYWSDQRIQQANPELKLPFREITLVTRQDSSGTTFAFTNHLGAISNEWRNRGPGVGKIIAWPRPTMVARGNEGVAARIKISNGSIGYVEYGYAERSGLAMAWLENRAGRFIKPLPDNGSEALANTASDMPENMRLFIPDPAGENSYPIVTYSWLLLYQKYLVAEKASALKGFVQWSLTEGQKESPALGFCPLPSAVVERGLKALSGIQ